MKKAIIKGSIYIPFEYIVEDPEDRYTKRFMKERVEENLHQFLRNAEKYIGQCAISGDVKKDFISNYSPPVITKKKIKK